MLAAPTKRFSTHAAARGHTISSCASKTLESRVFPSTGPINACRSLGAMSPDGITGDYVRIVSFLAGVLEALQAGIGHKEAGMVHEYRSTFSVIDPFENSTYFPR